MGDRTPPPTNRSRPPNLRRYINRRRRNSSNNARRQINFDEDNNDGIPDDQRPDYDPNEARGAGEDTNRNRSEPEQPDLKF